VQSTAIAVKTEPQIGISARREGWKYDCLTQVHGSCCGVHITSFNCQGIHICSRLQSRPASQP